jgi:ketosteroid isomerase-like protein
MSEHPNLARLRRGMAAFAAHDLATLKELIAPEIVWHHLGSSAIAGDYQGIAEIFHHFARRAALTGDTYAVSVQQAIACDEFITVLAHIRAEREEGAAYEDTLCTVYRIVEGMVVEAWAMPASPEREAEFYG